MRGITTRFAWRPWLNASDHVFISYRWCPADKRVATDLATALGTAKIDHFIDQSISRKGDIFRAEIATQLAACTHFFVVVSRKTIDGKVVRREIETAIQRWVLEIVPSVVCVVEPKVADELMRDSTTPLTIRYILAFCPHMSPAEARQPALVQYITEFTRRRGRLYDWLPFLTPATTGVRNNRLLGLAESDASP